ncbi:MAG: FAD-dependent oxidoreductase [Bryobacterales bacterium]|nr:FAD-dependent oxidoreductase [Bryobacterales bacterium]
MDTPPIGLTSSYVREPCCMVGEYVMRQQDLQTEQTKPDVIGMGSYNSDSHNIQRIVNSKGFAENEGDMQVAVTPYQIAYRMILPKARRVHQPTMCRCRLRPARRLFGARCAWSRST